MTEYEKLIIAWVRREIKAAGARYLWDTCDGGKWQGNN